MLTDDDYQLQSLQLPQNRVQNALERQRDAAGGEWGEEDDLNFLNSTFSPRRQG